MSMAVKNMCTYVDMGSEHIHRYTKKEIYIFVIFFNERHDDSILQGFIGCFMNAEN